VRLQVKGQRRELLISAEKQIDGLDKHEAAVQAALARAAAAPPVPVVRPRRMQTTARRDHAPCRVARRCIRVPGRLRRGEMPPPFASALRCLRSVRFAFWF
jgi:hypothetical protein